MKTQINLLGTTFVIASFNTVESNEMLNGYHFKHTIKINNKIQFTYHTSINDYQNGIIEMSGQDLLFAFRCFIQDSQIGLESSFSEFCSEFGYEEFIESPETLKLSVNMEAKKIYNKCVRSAKSYEKLTSLDAYDILDELSERGIE